MNRRLRLLALVAMALAVWLLIPSPPSFHRDVAPILRASCASCHHPGGPAPFALTEFAEVQRRAAQIVDVTSRRLMPPWMPEPGCGEFVGDRSLSRESIDLLRRWVETGAAEGRRTGEEPPPPEPGPGAPDLVVEVPEPYAVPADGPDVYRNFVVRIPGTSRRYVRALDFRPGNPKAVHHAFLFLDATRESERRDLQDPEPGFPGLHVPPTAQAPAGHFLSWQPGKRTMPEPEDLAWPLEPNAFLVFQVHLRPSGKPETVRPSAAFYFTDRAPSRTPVKIGLWSYDIDIPPGAAAHEVRDSYTLPADVDVLRVLPHAHYLARKMEAVAKLPDGSSVCLLRIERWDFNWQGDYAYRQPVFLPQGSVLSMVFTYDNSAENPRQPQRPPKRVRYGVQSSDEMAELWFQVVPRKAEEVGRIHEQNQPKVIAAAVAYNRYLVELDGNNARAQAELGKALLFQRRPQEALENLSAAVRLQPDADEPRYLLGLLHRTEGRLEEAKAEFRAAIRLNPGHAKAQGNLGLVLLQQGDLDAAAAAFEAALRLNPEDEIARSSLEQIRAERKRR